MCIASFDYFGKCLIVLSALSANISVTLFEANIGAPLGIASAKF